jgi:isopropylmalate/homocitrate/citramalate synthase
LSEQQYWVSPYNRLYNGKKIKIYDTTLRDGEQTLGVTFSAEEKLEIAMMLDEAGVDRIEAGMPVVSEEDKKAVKIINSSISRAQVFGFCRCNRKDVEAGLEAGVKAITCELPFSDYKWKAYNYSRERVYEMLLSTIRYAKENGLYVSFFAVDATRTDLKELERAYKTAVEEAGADEVVLVDTMGVATPETMAYLTRLVKSWVNVPLAVHCHNDFGMATACTFASLLEGAEWAHVTVNGLGEKTGNADLAETVLGGWMLYGFDVGIKFDKLYSLSKKVSDVSKIPVSIQKAVVGDGIFARESGIAVAQLLTYPPAVETFDPGLVGRRREVVLSKKSGKGSIRYVLHEMKKDVGEDKLDDLLAEVKELGVKKKGPLTRDEFLDILKKKGVN